VSFEIESLKEKDAEAAAKALARSLKGGPAFLQDTKNLSQILCAKYSVTLVGKKNGEIVGVIYGASASNQPTIALLGVTDEECAKAGMGPKLVEGFLAHVKSHLPNATAVRTSLPADFPEAIALYSSMGFVVEGFVKEYPLAQGRDMVFLKKAISRSGTPVT
jgi:hypothetical protein